MNTSVILGWIVEVFIYHVIRYDEGPPNYPSHLPRAQSLD